MDHRARLRAFPIRRCPYLPRHLPVMGPQLISMFATLTFSLKHQRSYHNRHSPSIITTLAQWPNHLCGHPPLRLLPPNLICLPNLHFCAHCLTYTGHAHRFCNCQPRDKIGDHPNLWPRRRSHRHNMDPMVCSTLLLNAHTDLPTGPGAPPSQRQNK